MLSQFIYGDSTSDGIGYSDITDQDWFYDPVMKMADSGYLTGYEDQRCIQMTLSQELRQ